MSKKESAELEFVKQRQKEIMLLGSAGALLHWDLETYMPKKAIEGRSEQLALLSGLSHEKLIDNKFWEAIIKLKKENLEADDKLMITRLEHDVGKSRKLTKDFVEELSKAQSKGTHFWEEAKKKDDFSIFEPYLKKIVELQRKKAEMYEVSKGMSGLYDALLDDFEEGMTSEKIGREFGKIKAGILEILRKVKSSKRYKEQKLKMLEGKYDKDKQLELLRDVWKRIGLEDDYSRIDFSMHPFSSRIGDNDVRMTTALRDNPLFAFESGIHESGHTLYSYNFPEKHKYDFLGWEPSLGVHESQSRFWENMVGKGKPFWRFYFPKFKNSFKLKGNLDEFYKEVNFVRPHFIRIESDELHYCMHVILRFEIEKDLIDGNIEVKDLPKIWNSKIKEYLGLDVKEDSKGVLQDVHWSQGYFGYFPTYLLGTIYAAQIFEAMKKDFDVEKEIENGKYEKIIDWLKEKIHKHGRKFYADELIQKATGSGLSSDAFLNYLNKKYGDIYGFE